MSIRRGIIFFWVLFLLIQQGERLFLFPKTFSSEVPTLAILAKTALAGFLADLVPATIGMIIALILWGVLSGLLTALFKITRTRVKALYYSRLLVGSCIIVATVLMGILLLDVGYYDHESQRLDYRFVDHMWDVFNAGDDPMHEGTIQTRAELQGGHAMKWVILVSKFFLLQGVLIFGWWFLFRRKIAAVLSSWHAAFPRTATITMALGFVIIGNVAIAQAYAPRHIFGVDSALYQSLAANPVLALAREMARVLPGERSRRISGVASLMPMADALAETRAILGPDARFLSSDFPLVRTMPVGHKYPQARPPNVLLVIVEALDRRYLGQSVMQGDASIRLTPFLDDLGRESVYFEHFFANGQRTGSGIFAIFCSYYPMLGPAVLHKADSPDFLCLPSMLRRGGYRTEMVMGQQPSGHNAYLPEFMSKNGLEQLFDLDDFPAEAERLDLGPTDGALFDFVERRIEALQKTDRPYFVSLVTSSTHHPFIVPLRHPAVRALEAHPDGYLKALRYFDGELERFFGRLQDKGLLLNTIVLLLGDHGRHETVEVKTNAERLGGSFQVPLLIWMDESLQATTAFRPRRVPGVASQVDVAPTILGLTGLMPRVSPFFGRDISCALVTDCLQGNLAFLNTVFDETIGLVDHRGAVLYVLPSGMMVESELSLEGPEQVRYLSSSALTRQYRRLVALYVSSQLVVEENRVWSWREFEDKL